nr:unnamed protein product [Callosobruchus chinensis]
MFMIDKTDICLLVLINVFIGVSGQNFWKTYSVDQRPKRPETLVTWCTISDDEQRKCHGFSMANERDQIKVGYETVNITCKQARNKEECMQLLDQEAATMVTLDAGSVFVGGRYHSLVPIAQEVLEGGHNYYFSVAVIKKGTLDDVVSLQQLRGKKACFPGVETFAGWVVPINTLMKEGGMEIIDCNNHIKSATHYFGPSCSVNCLSDKYNPIGDNSDKLCQLCIGKIPGGRCTDTDPYAGYEGAFKCLLEAGEIAFLKHNSIPEILDKLGFTGITIDSFQLLCKDGSRRPISDYLACNWGKVPSDAIVVSSATSFEVRVKLQKFLEKFSKKYPKAHSNITYTSTTPSNMPYGGNQYNQQQYDQFGNRVNRSICKRSSHINPNQYGVNIDPYEKDVQYNTDNRDPYNRTTEILFMEMQMAKRTIMSMALTIGPMEHFYESFSLFESAPRYGDRSNLLFQDATRHIAPLPENLQTFSTFLGTALDTIMGVRDCPVHRMVLCVTSDAEKNKCVKMRTALKSQLLKPEMECYKGHSQIHCMQAIRSGTADVAVFDAGDIYTAGLGFELVPFISEVYNLDDPEYFVVAVAKESDPNKNTCHGGINTAAGWVYPLAFLISNGWIRPYGCNSIRAAAEYFAKSCVPGAISTEYNTGVPYDNMCDLCHGASFRYCRRDASEDYYGHTGAFRCLVEGGGHVAFVKHTTVTENTGGKKREWWARDNLNDDYELLCPDGTRAEIHEYKRCNLGKVKANAIVTRGGYGYNETHINAYINLFMYAQTLFGKKSTDEFSFSMYSSPPPFSDLIFQDATTQLKVIEPHKRHYAEYLGSDFLRAKRVVDCHAGSIGLSLSVTTFVICLVTFLL